MAKYLFLFSILFCLRLSAQTPDEAKAILEPVNKLFTGMNLGDSAMVHAAFTKEAILVSVGKAKDGSPALRKDPLQKFFDAVGTPHDQKWNEPIWDTKILVDGNLAQVWAKYAFYLGKTFSHCGVDAFDLFKGADGKWRIIHLADTRQRESCQVPKEISEQFK